MALTDTAIRNAKPNAKEYKVADSAGLYLLVTPAGGKLWRLKYRFDGREKKLALGAYPAISLAKARKQRDEAREGIASGKDPSREKQRARQRAKISSANTFGQVANEYLVVKTNRKNPYGMAGNRAPSPVGRVPSARF